VLRYLPTNLPAPEIASELVVSVNTIRTHTRHLYNKLGVHTRTEAVQRARELSLLAPSPHARWRHQSEASFRVATRRAAT
jgi:LuxR family transcriptional regulator, maltose regulon positive regulatory protein